MILIKENLISFTKEFYNQTIIDIDLVLGVYKNSSLGDDMLTNLNNIFGENNLIDKINVVETIERIRHLEAKIKKINIDELKNDLPEYLLKEKIEHIIEIMKKIYEYLKYLESYYSKLFSKTNGKKDTKEYFDIFVDVKNKVEGNIGKFQEFSEKYKHLDTSKSLLDKLSSGFYGFWTTNYKMSFLITIVIILAGSASLYIIPKESSPKIDFGIILISTMYEGASPEDVDNLITSKIEKKIENIEGIKKITSNSSLGFSSISVELDNGVDISKTKSDITDKVDAVSLPTDAEDPSIIELSTNNELMFQLVLYGKKEEFSNRFLYEKARMIKEKLEGTNGITSIDVGGKADGGEVQVNVGGENSAIYDIEVLVDKNKLENIGLSIGQLSSIIRGYNKNQPLGTFKIGDLKYDFRISGEFSSLEELSNTPIPSRTTSNLTLKDIASIKKSIKDDSEKIYGKYGDSGYNYVTLNINKSEGANIFSTAKNAKEAIKNLLEEFQFKGIKHSYSTDLSDVLIEDYRNLANNGVSTIVLVFITLLFFVGIKESIIACIILPITFLVTFIVLNILGLSLNFLTNFSLILTLGIAIDTIIVVVEGASYKMKLGYNPMSAVLLAINEYKRSLMSGTATTIFAFIPMMFLPGIMGKFLAYIPITIFATLAGGLVLSLTILSAIFYKLNKPSKTYVENKELEEFLLPEEKSLLIIERQGKTKKELGEKLSFGKIVGIVIIALGVRYFYETTFKTPTTFLIGGLLICIYIIRDKFFHILQEIYSFFITNVLKNFVFRMLTIFGPLVLLVIIFATIGTGLIANFTLFPSSDVDVLYINASAKTGTDKEVLKKYIQEIDYALKDIKEIDNYTISIGGNSISSTINLQKKLQRQELGLRTVFKVQDEIREKLIFLENNGLKLSVEVPAGGPPSGSPIGVNLVAQTNKDLQKLILVATEFENYLKDIPGTINISNSSTQTPGQFIFTFDKNKLSKLGITSSELMGEIYFALNGLKSGSIKGEFDDEDIIIKYDNFKDEVDPNILLDMSILTSGGMIKLSNIVNYKLVNSVASVNREDSKILIKIGSDVEKGYPTLEIQQKLTEFAKKYNYPEGISFLEGGENQENADLLIATGISFIIALILIFTVLVLQFSSYMQPFMIMYSIILSLIGVNIGLYLTGNGYSMTFGIGFISLTGIVVNDAILLIETINENLRKGLNSLDALKQAGKSRLEPIMVTTLTTCFGLLPIALQDEFWAGLGFTVVFGLFAGSFFTVFVIPVIYYEVFLGGTISQILKFFKKFKRRKNILDLVE